MFRLSKPVSVLLLSVVPLLYTSALLFSGRLQGLEDRLIDWRYRWVNPGHPFSERVLLLDIDEGTLERFARNPVFGRWPWRRDVFPPLLEYIAAGGPRLILFDLLFSEASPHDDDLAEIGAGLPVSHAMQFRQDPAAAAQAGHSSRPLPRKIRRHSIPVRAEAGGEFVPYNIATYPAGRIGLEAFALHSVTYHPDPDGVSRRSRLLFRYGEDYFPSLALRAFQALEQVKTIGAGADRLLLETTPRSLKIQLENGSVRIHYPPETEMTRAMKDKRFAMEGLIESVARMERGDDFSTLPVPPGIFRDRVVIIGTSAAALHDTKISPYGVLPGMMLHATVVSNLLDGHFLTVWPGWVGLLAALVMLPLSSLLVLYATQMVWRILVPLLLLFAYAASALILFLYDISVPLTPILVSAPVSYLGGLALLTLTEGAEKRKFKSAMSKYLSPDVLNEVISRGELHAEVGNRTVLTVLFSDIRSFTSISEKVDGASVVAILNEYLSSMVEVIFAEAGTLDKYIGDAIMAFWGAPVARPDHALRAVRAAFAMQRELLQLHRVWAQRGTPLLAIGIGIHTGEMIVGNIGSNRRLDYTVIGDNVNLGSRIEGLTKVYHVPILISESTFAELGGQVPCRLMDLVAVKGKSVPIAVYEPLSETPLMEGMTNHEYADAFNEAFDAYRNRQWTRAREIYGRFHHNLRGEDLAVTMMLERMRKFGRQPPGPGWDGSFTMTTK